MSNPGVYVLSHIDSGVTHVSCFVQWDKTAKVNQADPEEPSNWSQNKLPTCKIVN